ncbi:hypothetical protein PBY51_014283 [Eleginops maclovinus]|uniref:Uncharacterized protein n=1 Tax=Eleginops maclovinus TaxID=56733 RepID=A0AAN7WYR5_ELEMC|nr:hypothetical protein PBY51_014283 [Eleginops maclovinus]
MTSTQCTVQPDIDHSQLYWASCLPSTFRTLLSPYSHSRSTLIMRQPDICQAAKHTAGGPPSPPALGQCVMQRYKPLTGVLLPG